MYVHCMCVAAHRGQVRHQSPWYQSYRLAFPGIGMLGCFEVPHGYWELNQGSLQATSPATVLLFLVGLSSVFYA